MYVLEGMLVKWENVDELCVWRRVHLYEVRQSGKNVFWLGIQLVFCEGIALLSGVGVFRSQKMN